MKRGRLLNLSAIARVLGPALLGATLFATVLWFDLHDRPTIRPNVAVEEHCQRILAEARLAAGCRKAWVPLSRDLTCLSPPTPAQLHDCGR